MEVIGNILFGCLLVIIGAALIAGQFACTISNGLEKYKKEQEKDEKN